MPNTVTQLTREFALSKTIPNQYNAYYFAGDAGYYRYNEFASTDNIFLTVKGEFTFEFQVDSIFIESMKSAIETNNEIIKEDMKANGIKNLITTPKKAINNYFSFNASLPEEIPQTSIKTEPEIEPELTKLNKYESVLALPEVIVREPFIATDAQQQPMMYLPENNQQMYFYLNNVAYIRVSGQRSKRPPLTPKRLAEIMAARGGV